MSKTVPWYSVAERVYHNNLRCSVATGMSAELRRDGTGGKYLCPECERLNAPLADADEPALGPAGTGKAAP